MKNLWKNFIKCGITGWCLEILFTAFASFRKRDLSLKGTTSLWMFPIYGMASLLAPLCHILRERSLLFRGVIYTICIFIAEYFSGNLLTKHHLCPWNYHRSKFQVKKVIRLDYAPYWFITGLLFECVLRHSFGSHQSSHNNDIRN